MSLRLLSVPDEVIASIRQQEEAGLIKLSDPSDLVTWRKGQSLALVGPTFHDVREVMVEVPN